MSRLSGKNGSIYLQNQATKMADSFMWEWEAQQTLLDCTIKGERWKRYVAQVGEGRVRIQSFVPSPGTFTPVSSILLANLVTALGAGTPIDFVLDLLDGTQTLIGQGYVMRSQVHVARDAIIIDEMEIQVDGFPTLFH